MMTSVRAQAAVALVGAALMIPSGPVRADGGAAVGAGIAGFVLGAAFPFVSGYAFHPTGYWYVTDPVNYRYPVSFYQWYAPAGGYIYVGPNWRTWYQYRDQPIPPPPYFAVPPKRFVYYPPVQYYYGPTQPSGGYR
jgi:hypothetical protein